LVQTYHPKNINTTEEKTFFSLFNKNTAKSGEDFILQQKLFFQKFVKKMKLKIKLVVANGIWTSKIRYKCSFKNRRVKFLWPLV
jgi:hypothetical protein